MSKNRRPRQRDGTICKTIGAIKIAGYAIPIRVVKGLKVDGGDALGAYRYVNPMIWVNKAIYGQEKAHTILHEALHALDRLYKIGLRERQIAALEVTLGDLITNNPRLMKALGSGYTAPTRHAVHRRSPKDRAKDGRSGKVR